MSLRSGRPLIQVALGARSLVTVRLSDNLAFLAPDDTPAGRGQGLRVMRSVPDRPVAIMLPWLLAKQKSVQRYANFYLSQGFDVLVSTCSPRQLLFPETGSQLAARQVVEFLRTNDEIPSLVVHGFSIGAYYWGEVLNQMQQLDPHRNIARKITGAVFDSPADLDQIPVGLPLAVSSNPVVQKLIAAYARFHLRTFDSAATRHYREARRQFAEYPLDGAAYLFLWSENDPVTSCSAIFKMIAGFEQRGCKVFYKRWPDSTHVRHLIQHPSDYHSEVLTFLKYVGHLHYPDRFPGHQQEGEQKRTAAALRQ